MTDHTFSPSNGNICIANIGSMTHAQKAQKALLTEAIQSSVTKISAKNTSRGCSYGVKFPCAQLNNVKTVLSRQSIAVREYL